MRSKAREIKQPHTGSRAAAHPGTAPGAAVAVVQRYKTTNAHSVSDDLQFDYHRVRKDSPYSYSYEDTQLNYKAPEKEEDEPTFTGVSTDKGTGNTQERFLPGLPSLKVSENNKLAILDYSEQSRDFFGTEEAFNDSNQKLAAADAKVRLGKEGGQLKLTQEGEQLFRLVPNTLVPDREAPEWAKTEKLSTFFCNQVVDHLIGSGSRVSVLAKKLDEQNREEQTVPMKKAHTDPTWLRQYLSTPEDEKPGFNQLDKTYGSFDTPDMTGVPHHQRDNVFMQHDQKILKAASDYETLDPQVRDEQAELYGVNEHALPEPGEGYMFSSGATGEFARSSQLGIKRKDYIAVMNELNGFDDEVDIAKQNMSAQAQSLLDTWSYHFAAVVARDGADTVTLENYNRGVERTNILRSIFHNLLNDFEEIKEEVSDEFSNGEEKEEVINFNRNDYEALIRWMHEEIPKRREQLSEGASTALQQAYDTLHTGLVGDAEYQKSLIYFSMYGPGEQSFHSQFLKTGFNPVTVRVREQYTEEKQKFETRFTPALPQLRELLNTAWKTGSGNYCTTHVLNLAVARLEQMQHKLSFVSSMPEMNDWKATWLKELDQTGELNDNSVLIAMYTVLNGLVPFTVEYTPGSGERIFTALRRVNELNAANTTFTFESTLKENFRDLGLKNYDLPKNAQKDLATLEIVLIEMRRIIRRFKNG